MLNEELENKIDKNKWSLEDIQEKIKTKLANIFSFYNEQEFLDEIHGTKPV
jgi:hypothetical protein